MWSVFNRTLERIIAAGSHDYHDMGKEQGGRGLVGVAKAHVGGGSEARDARGGEFTRNGDPTGPYSTYIPRP